MCKYSHLKIGDVCQNVSINGWHLDCNMQANQEGQTTYLGHREMEIGIIVDLFEWKVAKACKECGKLMNFDAIPCEDYTLDLSLKLEMPERLCWSKPDKIEEVEVEWSKPWTTTSPEEIKIF